MIKNKHKFILASASPRRRELLDAAGIPHSQHPANIDEVKMEHESPTEYSMRNARSKATAIYGKLPLPAESEIIIAADTIVVQGAEVFGKPLSTEQAGLMLRRLSGKSHQVITAVSLLKRHVDEGRLCDAEIHSFATITDVEFKHLKTEEIQRYIIEAKVMDKAGAYAAQGNGGYIIKSIKGSYTNVIGLPMVELMEALVTVFGIEIY